MKMQKLMGALILILMLGATPVTAKAAGLRSGPQGCNQGAGAACEAAL